MAIVEVDKLWGSEQWIENSEKYCVKLLLLNPGFQSSMHYHKVKEETFVCVAGRVKLEVMPFFKSHPDQAEVIQTRYLRPYQSFTLRPFTPHRFSAIKNGLGFGEEAIVVEASTFHSDDDVVRLEESRAIGS